jgi:polyhydroxyalkanoate synthesis regulator phasin
MVKEALRGYLSLASGLTDITATRARAAARSLVEQGEATAGQVSALAEDLIATSRRNRESLLLLVRHEVEQAVRRIGVGASSDVESLTTRVRELERTVRELRARATRVPEPATSDTAAPAKKASAQKSAAKKASTKKAAAKKAPAKKAPAARAER